MPDTLSGAISAAAALGGLAGLLVGVGVAVGVLRATFAAQKDLPVKVATIAADLNNEIANREAGHSRLGRRLEEHDACRGVVRVLAAKNHLPIPD